MQWVAGIEDDEAYETLAREAITVQFRGERVLVCGLEHLRAMKKAAGREEDLRDLRELDA
jgi:predicted nucleotidyltransferase